MGNESEIDKKYYAIGQEQGKAGVGDPKTMTTLRIDFLKSIVGEITKLGMGSDDYATYEALKASEASAEHRGQERGSEIEEYISSIEESMLIIKKTILSNPEILEKLNAEIEATRGMVEAHGENTMDIRAWKGILKTKAKELLEDGTAEKILNAAEATLDQSKESTAPNTDLPSDSLDDPTQIPGPDKSPSIT